MKTWYNHIIQLIEENREDLEYLLYVGLPGGILILLLSNCLDNSKLF